LEDLLDAAPCAWTASLWHLLALAYRTTAPNRWTKNNLENMPNADL
jgi:hypothetical protein